MTRVLVIDEALPWPPDSGKRIRTTALLTRLAKEFEILLAYADAGSSPEAQAQARAAGVELLPISRQEPRKRGLRFAWDLGRNLLMGAPYMVMAHRFRALRSAITQIARTRDIDLIHIEWTPLVANVAAEVKAPIVLAAHNVEADIWQRYHEHETRRAHRAYIAIQAKKVQRFEQQAFREAKAITAVSENDAQRIAQSAPAARVVTVPNGVDTRWFSPDPDVVVEPERCVFVGALDWRPNQDAVRWLLDEIWPAVLAQRPGARCQIVGRHPPAWLGSRVASSAGATLFGDVPDVRPFVRSAALSLVPLRIGGGSRLKICEALSMGRPVISTPIGAEGLDLPAGLTLADGAPAFAAAILAALQEPEGAAQIAQTGRALVLERYDWDRIAPLQAQLWRSLATSSNRS